MDSNSLVLEGDLEIGVLPSTLHVRVPRQDDPSALIDAMALAVDDTRSRLQNVLRDIDPEVLRTGPTRPLRGRITADLGIAEIIDHILAGPAVGLPRVVIARDGTAGHHEPAASLIRPAVVRSPPRVIAGGLGPALAAGDTIVVHSAEVSSPTLESFVEDLERLVGTQSGANLYLSGRASTGFGKHWDDHDVLVIQAKGSKNWRVFEPLEPWPLRPYTADRTSTDLAWEGVLEPGDVLVIPRGYAHEVDSPDLSLHATFPLYRPTGVDVAGYVLSAAGHWPLLRGDLPYDLGKPSAAYGDAVLGDAALRTDAFRETFSDLVLENAIGQWLAKIPARCRTSPTRALRWWTELSWDSAEVRLAAPGGMLIASREEGARIVVALAGSFISAPDSLTSALSLLANGRPCQVGDLPASEAARTDLVRAMARTGLVEILGDP